MFDIVVGASAKLQRTATVSFLIVQQVRRKCTFTRFNEKPGK